jgi:hypothetical protein
VTLAQVDGARRDLLETISHGPRGDNINVYSPFPCPALCAEVAMLKIAVLEGQVIQADFATTFATTQESARKLWTKKATPAGMDPAGVSELKRRPQRGANPRGSDPWPIIARRVR